jgi:hypothetical protein
VNIGDILDPGGDADALRKAADAAWRDMHDLLQDIAAVLAQREAALVALTWSGKDRDAYFRLREQDQPPAAGDSPLLTMADTLHRAADEIQKINDEVHRIYIEIAASLAIGGVLTLVTAGLSDAAAAAADAAAAAEAGSLVARLLQFLSEVATLFLRVVTTIRPFALRFAFQFRFQMGLNTVTGMVLRWRTGGSPLVGWTSTQLQEMQLGSGLGAAFAVPLDMPFAAPLRINPARPWLPAVVNMGSTALFGITYRVLDGVTLRHESPWQAIKEGGIYSLFIVLLAGTISGSWSVLATGARSRLAAAPDGVFSFKPGRYYWWEPSPAKGGLVGSVILGVGGSINPALSPFNLPPGLAVPGAPSSGLVPPSGVLPVPLPVIPPRPPIPPQPPAPPGGQPPAPPGGVPPGHPVTRGGGVRLVHRGDTLWAIAGRVYGDPRLWPAIAHANHLHNPDLIRTGETLVIPRLTLPEFGPPPRG